MLKHTKKQPVFKIGEKTFILLDDDVLSLESIASYKTWISIMHGVAMEDIKFSYEYVWEEHIIKDAGPWLVKLFQERRAHLMS